MLNASVSFVSDLRNKPDHYKPPVAGEVVPTVDTSRDLRFCRHCGSFNSKPGQCVGCYKGLGSIPVALVAGLLSAIIYGSLWALITIIFRVQLPPVAAAYGAAVSYAVSHYSRGRGISFQLIATLFTVLGMGVFDTLAVLLINHFEGAIDLWDFSAENWLWKMKLAFYYGETTTIFMVIGVLFGFWLWRYDIPDES